VRPDHWKRLASDDFHINASPYFLGHKITQQYCPSI